MYPRGKQRTKTPKPQELPILRVLLSFRFLESPAPSPVSRAWAATSRGTQMAQVAHGLADGRGDLFTQNDGRLPCLPR